MLMSSIFDQQFVVTHLVNAIPQGDIEQVYTVTDQFGNNSSWVASKFHEMAIPVGRIAHLEPHHQRLFVERAQLCDRITKLVAFIGKETFLSLHVDEQDRMHRQVDYMMAYRQVLDDRLIALTQKLTE
ncbi:hypothetical protein D3Q73_21195 [Salmonella enterica]|nr:hypothetical protein [Salmonella enterica]